MNLKLLTVLLAIGLGVVVAGCGGGGNSDKRANEAYANGVCSAIGTWSTEVKSLATVPTAGSRKRRST